jgi:4-hydroxy-tetrahydrodipicolinate synthase
MENSRLPSGVWPVLLTPFTDDRSIDWAALDALADWHIQAGAAGIFVDALSAEVLQLSKKDKLAIASAVVNCAGGRVPIFAGAFTDGPLADQIDFIRCMTDTGVQGVVITACQVVSEDRSDAEWQHCMEQILQRTGETPLGLYEMPVPYHRLLSPGLLGWAASTQRFFFHKDTTCNLKAIREKLIATHGTALGFFNANTPTLLDSLIAGGQGYSGIGANYLPELYIHLCGAAHVDLTMAECLQRFLADMDALMHRKYPTAAKAFLAMRGAPIRPVCRTTNEALNEDDMGMLRQLLESARIIAGQLGLSLVPVGA